MIRGLENTLVKLLLSLEFFDEPGRKKLGIGEPTPRECPRIAAVRRGCSPVCPCGAQG